MNSYDIIAEAVRNFWKNKNFFVEPVIVFFQQKYDFADKWDDLAVLVDCESPTDDETVIFETDFCEGETCVKDMVVVPFDEVKNYYKKNKLKR